MIKGGRGFVLRELYVSSLKDQSELGQNVIFNDSVGCDHILFKTNIMMVPVGEV